MWEIGRRLRERREKADFDIGQVAAYEDVSKSYISQLETGKNQPNWPLLAQLARRYKTSSDYILGLTDDARPAQREVLPEGSEELLRLMQSMSARARSELQAIAQAVYEEDLKWRQYGFGVDAMENAFGSDFNEKLKIRLAFLTARLGSEEAAIAHIRDSILAEEDGK